MLRKLHLDFGQVATISMVLFAVIDVIGSIPAIITIRNKVGNIPAGKVTIASGIIMIAFLFLGNSILSLIGIDLPSFAIAGAVIIFILALEMILGINLYRDNSSKTAMYVPIAFPLIAGAGTLTTLLSLRAQYVFVENIVISVLINLIIVYFVLRNLFYLEKLLGEGGINIMRKIFGVILLALAVKLFKSNA
jgi:multiple antibiotic resistance protein